MQYDLLTYSGMQTGSPADDYKENAGYLFSLSMSYSKVLGQMSVLDVADINLLQKKIFRYHSQMLRKAKRDNALF